MGRPHMRLTVNVKPGSIIDCCWSPRALFKKSVLHHLRRVNLMAAPRVQPAFFAANRFQGDARALNPTEWLSLRGLSVDFARRPETSPLSYQRHPLRTPQTRLLIRTGLTTNHERGTMKL